MAALEIGIGFWRRYSQLFGAVTLAQPVAAGSFQPPSGDLAPFRALPAFCRVAATLHPTTDSEIRVEVWLPERAAWNGKYEGVGNGGWGGSLNYSDMATALL